MKMATYMEYNCQNWAELGHICLTIYSSRAAKNYLIRELSDNCEMDTRFRSRGVCQTSSKINQIGDLFYKFPKKIDRRLVCFELKDGVWVKPNKVEEGVIYFFVLDETCLKEDKLDFDFGLSVKIEMDIAAAINNLPLIKIIRQGKKNIDEIIRTEDLNIRIDVKNPELWFFYNYLRHWEKRRFPAIAKFYIEKMDTAPYWGDNSISLSQKNFLLSNKILSSWKRGRIMSLIEEVKTQREKISIFFPEGEKEPLEVYDCFIEALYFWERLPKTSTILKNDIGLINLNRNSNFVEIRPFYRATEFHKEVMKHCGEGSLPGDVN